MFRIVKLAALVLLGGILFTLILTGAEILTMPHVSQNLITIALGFGFVFTMALYLDLAAIWRLFNKAGVIHDDDQNAQG